MLHSGGLLAFGSESDHGTDRGADLTVCKPAVAGQKVKK